MSGVSRGAIRRLLDNGLVRVNGGQCSKGTRLRCGDEIEVAVDAATESPVPQPEIVSWDETAGEAPVAPDPGASGPQVRVIAVRPSFVVVAKPPQMPSYPLIPGERGTAANAIVACFPECAKASPRAREGGLVHRLDRCTSGVLLAARSPAAYAELRELFDHGAVHKEYWALVAGCVDAQGVVSFPLERMPGDPRLVRPAEFGAARAMSAETHFAPLARLGEHTLLRVWTRTGRRHQVRAHLAAVKLPLVGDVEYGGPACLRAGGAFLHARSFAFGDERFAAELPPERTQILRDLGWVGDRDGEREPVG